MIELSILPDIPDGMSIWTYIGGLLLAFAFVVAIIVFAVKVAWEFLTDWRTPLEKFIDSIFGR